MDDLSWFVRAHENVLTTRNEVKALRAQLEGLFKDLCTHFSGNTPPAMTTSMLNLCDAIKTEIRLVYGTRDRNIISRLMQADQDLDKITGCYRRIQGHLERVVLNASLSIWATVGDQATEAQLSKLNPSLSAYYDSAEANVVQRRECVANTREQVLRDLCAWKDNKDGEKVCWINGMAGTGKTTITNTLCSTLDKSHELGASFFCTRLIPACRDVKLILPTIAHQLARFSSPFRNALLQVLEQDPEVHSKVPAHQLARYSSPFRSALLGVLKRDPEVHSKVPRVQFRRMILEPLQQVVGSLPTRTVVIIDALDECDDGNGVEQILEMLLENASSLPIKFLVSSRPEHHIRERIHRSALKTQLILHELDQKMVKADIATYLRAELASLTIALTNDQIDALVERAGALFIYAATVVRYIRGGDTLERLEAVMKVPGPGRESSNKTKEIDRLYEAVLVSALDNEDLEDSEKARMKLVLRTVANKRPESTMLLAKDAQRFVILFATSPVSQSTPHLYVSMLASWPDCEPVAHHYAQQAIDLIQITGLETTERQLGLLSLIPVGGEVLCVAYSPNGRFFAAGTRGGRILIWDAVSCRMTIDPIKGHTGPIRAIAISPDGTRICSGSDDKTLCIWDPQNGQLIAGPLKGHTRWIRSVDYSPNGLWLASGSNDGTVCIWSTADWKQKGNPFTEHGGQAFSVAFSPDGSTIAIACELLIYLWDPFKSRHLGEPLKGHTKLIWSLAFLPDGKHLISGSHDSTICVWDITSGQIAFGPFREHTSTVAKVAVSPNGHLLASAAEDDTMRVWNTQTWQTCALFQNTGMVRSVVFSPDGSHLLSGSADGNIRIWEVPDAFKGQLVDNQQEGHSDWVRSVAFLPSGTTIISGSSDMTVCIWDLQSRQLVRSPLKGHNDRVLLVGASSDGNHIFSVSADRMVYVWGTQSGQLEYTIGPIETDGQNDALYQEFWPVDFLFDDRRVVCGSQSGRIYMWDDSKLSFSFTGHNHAVYAIAFSPDGQSFISGSRAGLQTIAKMI
ncbi:hypothetical protein RSAG8_12502, partial [Rhizoctonia solani AG-8 WAC10335]